MDESKKANLLLIEVTRDEAELLNRFRAIYTEVKKGKTYREKPTYVTTTVETPDKIVQIEYNPLTTEFTEHSKSRSPDTISFGTLFDGQARLDFISYPKFNRIGFYIYLKGHRFWVDRDNWRKLFRINNKTGGFLGVLGRNARNKRRKKRS